MNPPSDQPLVACLSEEVHRLLSSLIPPGTRVALINFPNHANAGDPALWLGELTSLRRVGARIIYRASWASYRREDLARVLRPADTILLHGGGNFGDLYLHNQAHTRLCVLADFPHHRTLQLAQSIWFQEARHRQQLKERCEAHDDFTLLVRDAQSLQLARAHFHVPIHLCPDMAFALGSRPRMAKPRIDILWLARSDVESSGYPAPRHEPDVAVVDWLTDLPDEEPWPWPDRLLASVNRRLHQQAQTADEGSVWSRHILAATFAPMARHWTDRGCRILARGRVVVTDRLHGHLLALLQNIPHVLIDNSYGKLRTMYDTWTHASTCAHWAESPAAALEKARQLAAQIR